MVQLSAQWKGDDEYLSPAGNDAMRRMATLIANMGLLTQSTSDVDLVLDRAFECFIQAVKSDPERKESRIEREESMLNAAHRALRGMRGSLAHRLQIVTTADQGENEAPVTLVTMHGSKGREFDTVFIVHCDKDSIPGRNETGAELEEERRLLYVAMTRARNHLEIHYARSYRRGRTSHEAYLCPFLFVPHSINEEAGTDAARVSRLMM